LIKPNFDGALKGNPRLAGASGVFFDEIGNTILIFASYLGKPPTMQWNFKLLSMVVDMFF
jgi:hypothetical protein